MDKKKFEKESLEKFSELRGIKIFDIDNNSESPDLIAILEYHGKRMTVGVEVTKYFSGTKGKGGSSDRHFEAEWRRLQEYLMAKLKKHSKASFFCNISASFWLKEKVLPSKKQWDNFVEELSNFAIYNRQPIKELAGKGKNWTEWTRFLDKFPLMQKYIRKITFRYPKGVSWAQWECSDTVAGWVGITEEELSIAIRPKCSKVSQYRSSKQFKELWLLVVSTGLSLSQTVGPGLYLSRATEEIWDLLQKCGFDKIFFYDDGFKWVKMIYPTIEK